MESNDTNPVCGCCGERIRRRPLIKYPPRVRKAFPERSTPWPRTYPALIKPWLGGVRAYWLLEEQAFLLENERLVRVDGIEPYIPGGADEANVLGEFYEKGKSAAEILEMVWKNEPSTKLDFVIMDAERPDENAEARAVYCTNLPQQQQFHVRIAQMIQVITAQGFKTWLDNWKGSLFKGAIAVSPTDPWLAPEWEVESLLPPTAAPK